MIMQKCILKVLICMHVKNIMIDCGVFINQLRLTTEVTNANKTKIQHYWPHPIILKPIISGTLLLLDLNRFLITHTILHNRLLPGRRHPDHTGHHFTKPLRVKEVDVLQSLISEVQ